MQRMLEHGWRKPLLLVLVFGTLGAGFGCGRADSSGENDRRLNRARSLMNAGDYPGAIDHYEKALQRRPSLARAHWEMATIYDQQLRNDLRAIYHYERFLELNPQAERRDLVEKLIDTAKLTYAASLPSRPNQAVQVIEQLQREKRVLTELLEAEREEIRRLRAEPVASAAVAARTTEAGRSAPRGEAPAGEMRAYVVQPGDTLSRIAGKLYNDATRWDEIYEANRDVLRSPASIRVGQTLKIP